MGLIFYQFPRKQLIYNFISLPRCGKNCRVESTLLPLPRRGNSVARNAPRRGSETVRRPVSRGEGDNLGRDARPSPGEDAHARHERTEEENNHRGEGSRQRSVFLALSLQDGSYGLGIWARAVRTALYAHNADGFDP